MLINVTFNGSPVSPPEGLEQPERARKSIKSRDKRGFRLPVMNGERRTENGERRTENGERRTAFQVYHAGTLIAKYHVFHRFLLIGINTYYSTGQEKVAIQPMQ
jgi:hypothetical protein